MPLDPRSFSLGFIAAYAFSIASFAVLLGVTCGLNWWKERKEQRERDCALDRLMADVAVRCIEHPTDARVN
jgi:hypothetical protein